MTERISSPDPDGPDMDVAGAVDGGEAGDSVIGIGIVVSSGRALGAAEGGELAEDVDGYTDGRVVMPGAGPIVIPGMGAIVC